MPWNGEKGDSRMPTREGPRAVTSAEATARPNRERAGIEDPQPSVRVLQFV